MLTRATAAVMACARQIMHSYAPVLLSGKGTGDGGTPHSELAAKLPDYEVVDAPKAEVVYESVAQGEAPCPEEDAGSKDLVGQNLPSHPPST